jgi:extradiol dioxygenase family protein
VASALRLSARGKRFSCNPHLQFSAQKGEAASYAGIAPA